MLLLWQQWFKPCPVDVDERAHKCWYTAALFQFLKQVHSKLWLTRSLVLTKFQLVFSNAAKMTDFTVCISSFKEFFQEACLSLAAQLNLCPKYSQPFILLHN